MKMRASIKSLFLITYILTIFAGYGFGQGEPSDTAQIIPTELLPKSDSVRQLPTPPKRPVPITYLEIDDTIAAHFLPERFELADEMTRSFGHDAGDFMKFCPSNFIVDYQLTPYRKTVSPFDLPGNRMNYILDNLTLNPLEHLLEPDNQIDADDIPDASAKRIYNIEGPLGLVFGADNATSSLIMRSIRQDSTVPVSRMVVDKGGKSFANTKGIFAGRSEGGASFRAALEYRKAEVYSGGYSDDAYHQWGELLYPIRNKIRMEFTGRLYHRTGDYYAHPIIYRPSYDRFRRDRDLNAGTSLQLGRTDHLNFHFRHQRSEARLGRLGSSYYRSLDLLDNSGTLSYEALFGTFGLKTAFSAGHQEFHDGGTIHKRWRSVADLKLFQGQKHGGLLAYFRAEKVTGFEILPSGLIQFLDSRESGLLSASIGYSSKFPRQYEIYLTPLKTNLVNANTNDYIEFGDSLLLPEKQLTGNITVSLGKVESDLTLSATGGKVWDGIDWMRSIYHDSSGLTLNSYITGNHDINFLTVSARKKIAMGKTIHWSGGASYHYIKVGNDTDPPYSPDYQGFAGLELYHYILTLDLHLYAYIEALYSSRYHGTLGMDMGEKSQINLKLSFRIKKFRFYYIFQDLQGIEYQSREQYRIVGRLNSYGITWDFLD
ncbi:hypothetical protein TRIP_C21228 [Candidatus Zixiibacteriota bacterium]|nr:hypothetical protein TRIP_C21228 [candidate division Zixibacteria bacterium]